MKTLIKQHLFDGKFEIQGEIAKGQTGTILYGYDLGLRQEVAIKVYHSHINGRLIRGKAFIEKSKPLLLLDHPNLIKIFKVEEEDDTPVIFMEFFDAPSLQQMIHDNGPLPVQDMLMLAREITEVLVHTHFQGIIHGTLHPGHVLVGPQGQIKVMDLGLSWILMDILSNCDEELLRPLPYFPPEIAKEELLNVSSDLYSLGFMMYEMITGTVPYAGLPKTSIMGKLAFDQADPTFDFPDTVPEAICDLIREMTRNKAQQRLQDATHVLTVINQQLSKLPLSKTSKFLPPEPSAPQPLTPDEPTEPTKTSAAPAHSTTPEPPFKRAPQVQRPQSSVNYHRGNSTKMLSKIGIILILIVVVGIAGTLGYWYRDLIEPHFSMLTTQPESPSQEKSLPQIQPGEREPSMPPAQDSLNGQNPLSEIEELSPTETPSLTPLKATESNTQSSPTSLSPEPDLQPDHPTITQPPKTGKAKQGTSLAPTQQQPASKRPITPVKEKPSKIPPTDTEVAPLPSITTTIQPALQKSMTQQPAANQAKPVPTPVPTPKQPESKQATTPEKQSSEITPITSASIPVSKTKTPKEKPIQTSPPKNPAKEASKQKNSSASSVVSSEKSTRKTVEKEIKELLKTLDGPTADSSSIPAP